MTASQAKFEQPSRLAIVQEVQVLTTQMLERAKEGELDLLPELEQQRQEKLKTYAALGVQDVELPELRTQLEQLLDIDNELRQLCEGLRDELAKKLVDMKTAKTAQAAYQENT